MRFIFLREVWVKKIVTRKGIFIRALVKIMAVVVEKHDIPLMPCSEKQARLLKGRKARIHSMYTLINGFKNRSCRLLQHASGYRQLGNLITYLTQLIEEQRVLLALNDQVFVLSVE